MGRRRGSRMGGQAAPRGPPFTGLGTAQRSGKESGVGRAAGSAQQQGNDIDGISACVSHLAVGKTPELLLLLLLLLGPATASCVVSEHVATHCSL